MLLKELPHRIQKSIQSNKHKTSRFKLFFLLDNNENKSLQSSKKTQEYRSIRKIGTCPKKLNTDN